jgi:hypothetical protein
MTTPATAEELRAAQEAEYGRYVAKEAIRIDNVLAFNPGDSVPASHVSRKVVDRSQVEDLSKTEKKG